ncbi:Decarbamoylnovobiocin carbamoyltransferase [bacterium HR37]|jgi:carbamoyltransferase|nr:Decarbamoylnovobiocin carbamoyltransferase [bacterium HR37]
MVILGIADSMTSGAALIKDGIVVSAVSEERLNRQKMAWGFPWESIRCVLDVAGVGPEEVDAVAVATENLFFRPRALPYDGWFKKDEGFLKETLLSVSSVVPLVLGAKPVLRKSYYTIKSLLTRNRRGLITGILRKNFGLTCPVKFVDHHFAHACSAYFTSGMDECTVITMDGAGDNSSSHVYKVKDGRFEKLCDIDSFDSIGNYYAYITHICGFKAHKHEGKITGLAAYGKPIYVDLLKRFISYEEGRIVNKGRLFYWSAIRGIRNALPASFNIEDLAASMQVVLEEICCQYVRYWVNRTGYRNVALAGGVFANVKLNQKIHELEEIESVFIHPGMGDEGLAVGAAFGLANELGATNGKGVVSYRLRDVYLGPEYSDEDIKREIDREGLSAEYVRDIEPRIAQLLSDGYVVARFAGRMEYGPRALGNRSILYQPTDPSVNDWLNKKLRRTEFMPFAPVTLKEYVEQCYKNVEGAEYTAKFMTITFNCTEWMKKHCPAVVHVDNTARPQIIDMETNPSYYRILEEYRKITGLPSIINTSFNMHEEPIVCTPGDAIRAFKQGHLDYLAIGNFLIKNTNGMSRRY